MSIPLIDRSNPLSTLRIGVLSSVLAAHLSALGFLGLPQPGLPLTRPSAPEPLEVVWLARLVAPKTPELPMPTPPIQRPPRPSTTAPPELVVQRVLSESAFSIPAHVVDSSATLSVDVVSDAAPLQNSGGMQIAYDDAPAPPYPTLARRKGWEGLVLLRVRVDAQGRPQEVRIERSSGHRLLDRTAREHVLTRWRFHPAIHEGRPVAAWAQVPLNFRIDAS